MVLLSLVMFTTTQCNETWSPLVRSVYVVIWIVSDDGLSVDFNVSVTTAANYFVLLYLDIVLLM